MRDDTPVLIGGGQFTHRGPAENSPPPLQLLKIAAEKAAADAGLPGSVLARIDALAVIAFSIDAPGALSRLRAPRLADPPASLAAALGADPAYAVYGETGGNSPQLAINTLCERIANGQSDLALVAGAEFLGALMKRLKAGLSFDGWGDARASRPMRLGDPRPGVTEPEAAHGLAYPVNTYPLFENALRARDGRSICDHQLRLGALFAPFTAVAAANPHAWFQMARSPEDLITVTP
ncbi:MAG: acetyl-CoA acetyltransferase, partial [Caulobacter sp.]|nr:acetyl-CoA acetyltransferase [Caulobacter sp.]